MRAGLLALLVASVLRAAPADDAVEAGLRAFRQQDWTTARAAFDLAVSLASAHPRAHYWRARVAAAQGDWARAVDDLELVLRLKPASEPSRLALAEARAALARLAARREPAIGALVGYRAEGVGVSPVEVTGPRLYDYTFGTAPTDWLPAGGTWSISSRYSCEPEWSFFGGHGEGICAIWNKRRFRGDLAVEAYLAFKHGLDWAPEAWHYVPSDLNLTLFGQQGNLASGYSFIYSGRNGSATMIRRGEQILAATREAQFISPQFLDRNPLYETDAEGRPFGQFHRHWWRLEARRSGSLLTLLIDGRKALEARDPAPLEAGQVALWTLDGGLVVARLRIACEGELPPPGEPAFATEPRL